MMLGNSLRKKSGNMINHPKNDDGFKLWNILCCLGVVFHCRKYSEVTWTWTCSSLQCAKHASLQSQTLPEKSEDQKYANTLNYVILLCVNLSIHLSIYAYVYIQSCTYVCIYNIHIKLYKMCDTPICISRYEGFPSHRGPPEVSSSMTTPWASAAGTWRYGQLWARAEGNDAKLNRWSDLMGCYSDLVEFYSDLTDTNVNLNQLTNLDGM